jgi:hypothetical protein
LPVASPAASPTTRAGTPTAVGSPSADARAAQLYFAQIAGIARTELTAYRALLGAVANGESAETVTQRGDAYLAAVQDGTDRLGKLQAPPGQEAQLRQLQEQSRDSLDATKARVQAWEQADPVAYLKSTDDALRVTSQALASAAAAAATPSATQGRGTPASPSPQQQAFTEYVGLVSPLTSDIQKRDQQALATARAANFDTAQLADAMDANLAAEDEDVAKLQQVSVPPLFVKAQQLLVAQEQHSVAANRLLVEGLRSGDRATLRQSMQEQARSELAQLDWSDEVASVLIPGFAGPSTQ